MGPQGAQALVPLDGIDRTTGDVIRILVGNDREVFGAHKELICASSPFFAKAMAGQWIESSARVVEMPEDEPSAFSLYIFWLYYNALPKVDEGPTSSGHAEYIDLCKAYVLGDKIFDRKFQNACIDCILEKSCWRYDGWIPEADQAKWHPLGDVVKYVYSHTRESDLIRKLLVDIYVYDGCHEWYSGTEWGSPQEIPVAFLRDITVTLTMNGRQSYDRFPLVRSDYYVRCEDSR